MTEFDFDELDKAVNSLMKKTPADDEPDAPEKVVTLPPLPEPSQANPTPQQPPVASGVTNQPEPAPSEISSQAIAQPTTDQGVESSEAPTVPMRSETSTATSPSSTSSGDGKGIVKKRRGTFMDVVHPSSDMRTSSRSNTAPSRQGATIAPPVATSPAPASSVAKKDDSVEARDDTPPVRQPVAPRPVDDRELATTLEEAVSQEAVTSASDGGSSPVDGVMPSSTIADVPEVSAPDQEPTTGQSDQPAQPHESLFIADAKVEKRPLGAQPQLENTPEPTPAPVKAKLPDELSGEVLAIESEKEATQVQSPKPQMTSDTGPLETSADTKHTVTAAKPLVPQTATEAEEDHPAIYDPAYYQQEAKPKTKKKSGWGIVLAIIGLIVLGGAGGVLYYFYTTGSF